MMTYNEESQQWKDLAKRISTEEVQKKLDHFPVDLKQLKKQTIRGRVALWKICTTISQIYSNAYGQENLLSKMYLELASTLARFEDESDWEAKERLLKTTTFLKESNGKILGVLSWKDEVSIEQAKDFVELLESNDDKLSKEFVTVLRNDSIDETIRIESKNKNWSNIYFQ